MPSTRELVSGRDFQLRYALHRVMRLACASVSQRATPFLVECVLDDVARAFFHRAQVRLRR